MERSSTSSLRKSGRGFPWSPSATSGPLGTAVAELRAAAKHQGRAADAQASAGEHLLKWALAESSNAGVRDVVYQTRELLDLNRLAAASFKRELDSALTSLQAVKEAEKAVLVSEKERRGAEADEDRARKDLKRTERWGKGGDATLVQHRLRELALAREAAERRLSDTRAEQEVVKMLRLRSGLEALATAHASMGHALQEIFKGVGDVSHQLPGISTENIRDVYYHGAPLTADRVRRVREELGFAHHSTGDPKARRRSAPAGVNRQRKIFDVMGLGKEAALGADTGLSVHFPDTPPHSAGSAPSQLRQSGGSASGGVGVARSATTHGSAQRPTQLPDFDLPPPAYAPMDPHSQASTAVSSPTGRPIATQPPCPHCHH